MEEEIAALKSPVNYSELMNSIHAVDEFFSIIGVDMENCPCKFYFNAHLYEWMHSPNAKPYAFQFENEKFYLSYESPEYYDYQFVIGKKNNEEKWRVGDIKYIEKAK
ncbi:MULTISPECIES: hypothetical protein [Cytobacillus]|uniref:hypothetical protein n=1 Tax=Cytobacillus TaxID=2675230 RepID=UPI00203DF705|nr:hypothetical protein [Cytobacillus oceanisediminis]MCM3243215.1 hypothetical protein [Cytobacillus oceanisediminis]MDK7665460.1 hypothetical protein [Cytobacillus oceanisediminis]